MSFQFFQKTTTSLLGICAAGSLISCDTLVDEMRIRRDPNTIVKPDVDELNDLEISDGTYIEPTSSGIDGAAKFGEGTTPDPALQEQPKRTSGAPYTPIQAANPAYQTGPPAGANLPRIDAPPTAPTPPQPPQYDPAIIEELR